MKRAPRFSIGAQAPVDGQASVTGAEFHHLHHVMRLKAGAEVMLIRDDGGEYAGEITAIESDAAVIKIIGTAGNQANESPLIILAAALIRGPRMDFLVEKTAELGAAELWPLLCHRCTARDPGSERLERWRRISTAAAKQSLSSSIMRVRPPASVAAIIPAVPEGALAMTCTGGGRPLATLLRPTAPASVVIACGPEGDFTPDELEAMTHAGFVRAGLGPNRLRSETAALAALSLTAGIYDELLRRS